MRVRIGAGVKANPSRRKGREGKDEVSEHSIEELTRQYDAARSKAESAIDASNAAKKRLTAAKLEATGLVGHVVSYKRGDEERRFVAQKFSGWSENSLIGPKIKKDGKLSERTDDAAIVSLTDHGLYSE